jgi:hypothetical protein
MYRAGELNEAQQTAFDELISRGELSLTTPRSEGDYRSQLMQEMAAEVGPLEAGLLGMGKGFMNVGRGLGLADDPTAEETAGFEALKEERPYTTGAGELAGEALPFIPMGMGVGNIAKTGARVAASGLMGAAEGGIIAEGTDGNALAGAGIGGGIGVGAEMLFPVIGKMGRKIYQKVSGNLPRGAMLDASGKPTAELSEALQKAGISFEDLTQDATEVLSGAKPGTDPEQLARKALFAQEGIPATTGEIGKDFTQLSTEQRLLESGADTAAEPFRQFKLKQSEKIKETLDNVFGGDSNYEETGQLIQDSLSGRKKLLSTQKNELYSQAAEASKDAGGIPIFGDTITEAIPDADLMEDLAITAPQSIKSLDQILTKYGLKEPTAEAIEAGFEATPLTVANVERVRKTLNAISKGDTTGAAGVAITPIKRALDIELDELAGALAEKGVKSEIVEPLKMARKTVRELKTEFSPQSIVGKMTDVKKDGVTQVVEASQVYNRLIGAGSSVAKPVENVRKVIKALGKAPGGDEAIASLQATTMLDLIDAGFGTESRKISGKKVFNPIAFRRRVKAVGQPKLQAMFSNNPAALKKINNIDKIATELVPPSGTQPKGSASVMLDIADKLGFYAISAKVPGLGPLIGGAVKGMTDPIKTGAAVKTALKATPEVEAFKSLIERQFPGIASAIAIPIAEQEINK